MWGQGTKEGICLLSVPHVPFIWRVGLGTDLVTTLSFPLRVDYRGQACVMALLDMDSVGDVEFVGCLLTLRNVEIPHPVNLRRCESFMFSGTENTAHESSGPVCRLSATVFCKEHSPYMGSQEPDHSAHQFQGLFTLPFQRAGLVAHSMSE